MVVLGSTGSIGRNSLEIADRFSLPIEVLTANSRVDILNSQIEKFSPEIVVVGREDLVEKVNHKRVYWGENGILRAIEESRSEVVINSLVGFAGLRPTLQTLEVGKKLALANKESLVVAGAFLDRSKIQPIDSEHFALWYLLNGREVENMTITASGGAFRDWDTEKIWGAKSSEALKHPNWSMGNKITVDSASMVNKMFELLEAKWLFNPKELDAVIEKKSLFHALVQFRDGSTTAHISGADMKLPIAYALLEKVDREILKPIDLLKIGEIEFLEIDKSRYPIWQLKDYLLKNPKKGLVLNSANDMFVERFLQDKIAFGEISSGILECFDKFGDREPQSLDEVFEIDREVRASIEEKFRE
jgi:1-deoxy-D-xylulose-5-phosphate reductoisomerase